MLPCFRCGAPAVGYDGACRNCGVRAFVSPYGTPAAAYRPRRQIRGLGLALMIALGVTAAEFLGLIAAMAWRHRIVSQIVDEANGIGDGPELSTVQHSDDLVRVTLVLAFLAIATCAVLLICWLYTARCNAGTYGPVVLQLSPGWAIGAWFVPVGYLFLPLVVALDTHRGTTAGRTPGRRPSGGAITGWWWGCWLGGLATLVAGLLVGGSKGDDVNDSLHYLHGLQALSLSVEPGIALLTVAALLLLLYVRKITGIQVARAGEPVWGGMPVPPYGMPVPPYGMPVPPYGTPGPPYGTPAPPYGTPAPPYGTPMPQHPDAGPAAPPPNPWQN